MDGLKPSDNGHYRRGWAPEQRDCPQYAEDQERGGMCAFCRDAHALRAALAPKQAGMSRSKIRLYADERDTWSLAVAPVMVVVEAFHLRQNTARWMRAQREGT
jgi:hypothetical protein